MSSLNRWFRKNQKKLLAWLVVLLMVAWGIGPAATYLIPKKPYGTIAGEKISRDEIFEMAERWKGVLWSRQRDLTGGMMANVWQQLTMVKAAERAGLTVTEAELDDALDKPGGRFTWIRYQIPRGTPEKVLRKTVSEMLLGMKAREYLRDSLHATTAEAWHEYALQNEQVKVRFAEISAETFEPLVEPKDEELRAFYEEHKDKPVSDSGDTVGYKQPEKVKIEYILARNDDFKKDVKVTDEQIETYYSDNKDMKFRLPDPEPEEKKEDKPEAEPAKEEGGKEGAEAEDATSEKEAEKPADGAEAEPAKEEAGKEDAEAVPEKEAEKPADGAEAEPVKEEAGKEEAETADAAAEKADAKPADEAKATTEVAKADEAKEADAEPGKEEAGKEEGEEEVKEEEPPKPRYRPLAEVREEIVKELTNSAAEEKAIAAINAVDVKIGEAIVDEKPVSFPGLAKEKGLVHKTTDFFTKDEAGDILLGAYKLADEAFDTQRFVKDPVKPLDCTDGKFIFQILAKRDPMPDPFEAIKDKVRADYVNVKALEKAKAFVLDAADAVEAKGFEAGVAELTKKLEAMVPPEPEKNEAKAEAGDAKQEGEKEEQAEEEQKPLIRVGETEFFSRPETYGEETYCYIPELEGDRPKVGEKAFKLKPDEYGVAVEETGQRAAYIIQVTGRKEADPTEFGRERKRQIVALRGRKQNRIMKKWDAGVKKTATVARRR